MKIAFSDQYIREVQWRVEHFGEQGSKAARCTICAKMKSSRRSSR
jgi:hypothetical protein